MKSFVLFGSSKKYGLIFFIVSMFFFSSLYACCCFSSCIDDDEVLPCQRATLSAPVQNNYIVSVKGEPPSVQGAIGQPQDRLKAATTLADKQAKLLQVSSVAMGPRTVAPSVLSGMFLAPQRPLAAVYEQGDDGAVELTDQRLKHLLSASTIKPSRRRLEMQRNRDQKREAEVKQEAGLLQQLCKAEMFDYCSMQSTFHINQDRAGIFLSKSPPAVVAVLADGHGPKGHEIAERITSESGLYQKIMSAFTRTADTSRRRAMEMAFLDMHLDLPSDSAKKSGAAVVAAFIYDGVVCIGHSGDSRAVVFQKESTPKGYRLISETQDHKPSFRPERRRIQSCGGEVHCPGSIARVYRSDSTGGLAISRSLGDTFYSDIGVISFPDNCEVTIDREKSTFLVMGSDGVWDVVSNKEAVQIVCSAGQMKDAAASLVMCARNKRSADDITVLVVDLSVLIRLL